MKKALPNRVGKVVDEGFIGRVMATLKEGGVLNLKASSNSYGLVVYPKRQNKNTTYGEFALSMVQV